MPKRRTKKGGGGGELRWVLTYSDMITLLLALFIMLYVMKTKGTEKTQLLAHALSTQFQSASIFGQAPGPSLIGGSAGQQAIAPPVSLLSHKMTLLKSRIEAAIRAQGLQNKVFVSSTPNGVRVSIAANLLFSPGHAQLHVPAKALLLNVGSILNVVPRHPILIVGFTDSTPIRTARYLSNWQLGAMRSANVTWALSQAKGFNPARIMQASFSKYRPKASNATAMGRQKNRHVDILVISHTLGQVIENTAAGTPIPK